MKRISTALTPVCQKVPSKLRCTTPQKKPRAQAMSRLAPKTRVSPFFLLDENVDIRVSSFLKDRGHQVLICPKGLKNGAVLQLARKRNCILITNDSDFANPGLHDFTKTAGIVVFRLHPPKLESILSALRKLLNAVPTSQFPKTLFIVTKVGIEISRKP